MYQLEFLPMAKQDMTEIVKYISHELCNPSAAEKLSGEMIEAAERLMEFPYLSPVHFSIKPLKHEYRKLTVQNYIMFYRVDETVKKVTVARAVYVRRDYEKLLQS